MKYGAKMIAESTLQAVENSNPERDYEVDFTIPEFTCLCPQSNFPDFATIRIRYIPDRKLVGLQSLQLDELRRRAKVAADPVLGQSESDPAGRISVGETPASSANAERGR